MALDRRITLAIRGPGQYNDFDQFIPGAVTNYAIWAEYRPQDLERRLLTGGTLTLVTAGWRVRYFDALMKAADDLTGAMVIADNIAYSVTNIVEHSGRDFEQRRRFILVEGVHA